MRVQEIAVEVAGMTGSDCERRVSSALLAVPGVSAVRVSKVEGRAVVSGDPDVATPDALTSAIAQAGYMTGEVFFPE